MRRAEVIGDNALHHLDGGVLKPSVTSAPIAICREKADSLHALPDLRHELHGQLVRDLVDAQRIERAFARAQWVVRRQEWKRW